MADVEALTDPNALKQAWGAQLAAARKTAGRTQVEIARILQIDQTTVSAVERGTGSLELYLAYAAELGVNILGRDL